MPFTAGMRYKLASAISFSSMALTSPRWALTIISFSVNLYLRELLFGRSEEDREAYRYEDNLSVKCKFDKPYSTLQVSHAMKSTALCLAGQQLWGNTARRAGKREIHSLYTSHGDLPLQLFLLQFPKSIRTTMRCIPVVLSLQFPFLVYSV